MSRNLYDTSMTEADLQRTIIEAADYGGWLVFHDNDSRRNRAGFPDLTLARGSELIFAELKSATGRIRPDQAAWLDVLEQTTTVSSGVVRPDAELGGFLRRLTRRP